MAAVTGAIQPVAVPRWGMTMTEGKVVGWLKAEGDAVQPGDELAEIETSKITNVVEAAAAGTLRRHVAAVGATLPCGALIGVVADAGVPDAEVEAYVAAHAGTGALADADEAAAPRPRLVDAGATRLMALTVGGGNGDPLVLVHGFGGQINTWLFNQDALASDRPVHVVELPGHGSSGTDVGDGSVGALAAAVLAALDSLGVGRAHLAGHSLGGAVCLDLAARAPGRVASLTLIAPLGLGPDVNAAYVEGYLAAARRPAMKAALELLFADPGLVTRPMTDDALAMKRTDGVQDALARIAAAAMPGGRQAYDGRAALASLPMPVQVLWGEADRVIPPAHGQGLPAGIALHILPGAGHMPQMEQAATVNARLAALVRGAP